MSAVETFEKWFNELSKSEQLNVIKHIAETKISPITEGLHAGPSGALAGVFTAPSGRAGVKKCPTCGR